MPQSFRRNCTVPSPMPRLFASAVMRARASSDGRPSHWPGFTMHAVVGDGFGQAVRRRESRRRPDAPPRESASGTCARTRSRARRARARPSRRRCRTRRARSWRPRSGTCSLRERVHRVPAGEEAFLLDLAGHARGAILRAELVSALRRSACRVAADPRRTSRPAGARAPAARTSRRRSCRCAS